jgi:cell fate (sporulation/competence/biofilm development) regulator YlbF (YheA/YmcA/DUF963 family)
VVGKRARLNYFQQFSSVVFIGRQTFTNIRLLLVRVNGLLCGRFARAESTRAHGMNKKYMPAQTDDNAIDRKTRELCQTILDQPNLIAIRGHISAFMADEKSRAQYESVVTQGQALHEKQQMAQTLEAAEIADFEKQRDTLLGNPVVRSFLGAQEELNRIQDSIFRYVSKTLALGRLPGPDDLADDACGGHHGCGCQH